MSLGMLLGGISGGYADSLAESNKRKYEQDQQNQKLQFHILQSALENPALDPSAIPIIFGKLGEFGSAKSGKDRAKQFQSIGELFSKGIPTQVQTENQVSRPGVGESELPNPQGMNNAASGMGISPITQEGELPKGNINFDNVASMIPAPTVPGQPTTQYRPMFRSRDEMRAEKAKDVAAGVAATREAEEPYKKADDERTASRQIANRKAELENRLRVIDVQFKNTMTKLNSPDQLKANLELQKITNQYIAAGMEPDEAKLQAATILTNQLEARLANTQADTQWKLGQPSRAADVAADRDRGLDLRERSVVVQEQKAQGLSDADQTKIKQFMDDNQQLKNQAIAAYNAATTDNERNQIKAEYDRRARELGESARALLGNNVEIGADESGWYYIKPGAGAQTQSSTQSSAPSGQGKTISMDQLRQQAAKGGVDINALIERAKQRGFTITGQ
jgi:hypothetical protein